MFFIEVIMIVVGSSEQILLNRREFERKAQYKLPQCSEQLVEAHGTRLPPGISYTWQSNPENALKAPFNDLLGS